MGGEMTRGNAHLYTKYKKEILKSDYNIEWKSPQELNPRIKFNQYETNLQLFNPWIFWRYDVN